MVLSVDVLFFQNSESVRTKILFFTYSLFLAEVPWHIPCYFGFKTTLTNIMFGLNCYRSAFPSSNASRLGKFGKGYIGFHFYW